MMASSRAYWAATLLLVLIFGAGFAVGRSNAPLHGMEVTFNNASGQRIDAIQLDFGSADSQSSLQVYRIEPGQQRLLVLNHRPAMGFNVKVTYQDGQMQEFCALKGRKQQRATLTLRL
ncbi:hypothetical protein DV711_04475 [Motiliproteus coralliicola]|uniref:Uncharacterized protein n=1 Tax=Motiliproteus coralliicola TaxID=2283196 RepID=A0A369WWC2_9GAMM|nr:hypothetical protein [Motiliproteus coralliicola]RDE24846.1 hypothetical protein DV711_04475 [Motiliproteus coralliicola]